MRTIVYIDGFKLYFRPLEKSLQYNRLNIMALVRSLLNPGNVAVAIKYYAARVSGRINPHVPRCIRSEHLGDAQFANPLISPNGTELAKPTTCVEAAS